MHTRAPDVWKTTSQGKAKGPPVVIIALIAGTAFDFFKRNAPDAASLSPKP